MVVWSNSLILYKLVIAGHSWSWLVWCYGPNSSWIACIGCEEGTSGSDPWKRQNKNEQEKVWNRIEAEVKQKHLLQEWKHLQLVQKFGNGFFRRTSEPNPKRSKRRRFVRRNCVTHKIPSLLVTVSPSQMHKCIHFPRESADPSQRQRERIREESTSSKVR